MLYTNMRLQLADQSLCYPKGVLEDAIVRVGQSYVTVDFVVLETGGDERAPIILGRHFLSTTEAIIYVAYTLWCTLGGVGTFIKEMKLELMWINSAMERRREGFETPPVLCPPVECGQSNGATGTLYRKERSHRVDRTLVTK